ncbi:MAG: hypothetical protein OXT01_18420 [Rhodospirillaceae bacterium]|nr:hypothetical protein [Rhodospirillaceae bacterium]
MAIGAGELRSGMKKQNTKTRNAKKKQRENIVVETVEPARKPDRRQFLGTVRNWSIAAAVVGVGGWFLVDDIRATSKELDLSQIGKGIPTVVQIHDPQCPKCQALQREARKAMKAFGADELRYLVANIREEAGRGLARAHQVGHVTLLLFDGDGKRQEIVVGQRTSKTLEHVFRRHVTNFGPKKNVAKQ